MNPDYLTFTTTNPSLARALYALALGDGEHEPVGRVLMGAEGVQVGKLFIGVWDDGRWLCTAAGEAAVRPWEILAQETLEEDEWSVARVDLQMTILVPDADRIISDLRPHSRYKSTRISQVYERGETLYVGSAHSDKRLRVYNKTVQSGVQLGLGELLRVELQLRNSYADYALIVRKENTDQAFYAWWLETVAWMADGLRGVLPPSGTAHIRIPEEESRPTYAAWIRRCVLPALGKAKLDPEWEMVRRELLAALD